SESQPATLPFPLPEHRQAQRKHPERRRKPLPEGAERQQAQRKRAERHRKQLPERRQAQRKPAGQQPFRRQQTPSVEAPTQTPEQALQVAMLLQRPEATSTPPRRLPAKAEHLPHRPEALPEAEERQRSRQRKQPDLETATVPLASECPSPYGEHAMPRALLTSTDHQPTTEVATNATPHLLRTPPPAYVQTRSQQLQERQSPWPHTRPFQC